ncbi:hypothetical protein [Rhodococcus qingshengii]
MAFEPAPDTGQPGTVKLPDGRWAYRWKDAPDAELIYMKKPEGPAEPAE